MRIQARDVQLFFDVEGPKLVREGPRLAERPTVLLLHGVPGADHSVFKPFASGLADLAQVVYLDQRGNGRSEYGLPGMWRLETWADDVRAFCGALGIERPIVIGSAFGAFIALLYALRHPDHPGKLALLSAAARFRPERLLAGLQGLGGIFAQSMASFAEYMNAAVPRELSERLRPFFPTDVQQLDLRAELGKIQCPTLVLTGERDTLTPLEDAEELVAAIGPGRAELGRIPGAGHDLVHEAPDALLEALRRFVGMA